LKNLEVPYFLSHVAQKSRYENRIEVKRTIQAKKVQSRKAVPADPAPFFVSWALSAGMKPA
jgi:hypothetical protein